MLNPFHDIVWNPSPELIRRTGRSLALGALVVAVLVMALRLLLDGGFAEAWQFPVRIAIAGLLLSGPCLLAPGSRMALGMHRAWFALGAAIGIVVANALLAGFYYLVLTPYGVILRTIFRRDPLGLRGPVAPDSNWRTLPETPPARRYLDQY
jgi:hypothetical protein